MKLRLTSSVGQFEELMDRHVEIWDAGPCATISGQERGNLGDIEVLGLEFLAIHRGMLCVFPLQWESGMRDGNSGGR